MQEDDCAYRQGRLTTEYKPSLYAHFSSAAMERPTELTKNADRPSYILKREGHSSMGVEFDGKDDQLSDLTSLAIKSETDSTAGANLKRFAKLPSLIIERPEEEDLQSPLITIHKIPRSQESEMLSG